MSYDNNYERYHQLQEQYKVKRGTLGLIPDDVPITKRREAIMEAVSEYDVVVEYVGPGYAHAKYRVLQNKPNLSTKDLAIICDEGNLCFGYRTEGSYIIVHTD